MTAIELIYNAIKNEQDCHILPEKQQMGICALTGKEALCVDRKELLGKSFTNGDSLIRPDSDKVSIEAFVVLKYKWERMSSWFCDGVAFDRLSRIQVREKVFMSSLPKTWIGYATTSYKKHGVLNTPVNSANSKVWLFETRRVDLSDNIKTMEYWEVLNTALRQGIGRSVMETLDINPAFISKIGINNWIKFEQWARPRYQSALYSFLCYLLPSQEELKGENNEQAS